MEDRMSAADTHGIHAEGWTGRDAETLLRAVAPTFHFDTPGAAPIPRAAFVASIAGMRD
jgi:hypothetical protein